ncbi:hypothetical protein FRC08_013534 [Ceratobasidium sp. 394]|nr:hypothetical protein FRC08_013534 [Ceratobasidium sp. 394]
MSDPMSQAREHIERERMPKSEFARFLAAAPTTPASVDAATWSKRVITAAKNTIGSPCHGSEVKLLVALWQVMACLLSCIDDLDGLASRKGFDIPHPCPASCPGPDSGSSTPRPAVAVAHKAVATEPPLPKPPVVEAMDLDPPPVATTAANPVPWTYASVAVGTLATPASKAPVSLPKPSPKPHTPAKVPALAAPAPKPIRLIVRPPADLPWLGLPFAQVLIQGPSEPFRLLSHTMSLSPQTKDVMLLGVHQNRSKNLVVSLPAGTPDATIDATVQVIQKTLLSFGSAPVVDRDTPWSKLLVSRVLARPEPGSPTYTEAEVLASFLHLNLSVSALKITRSPRWIRNPALITGVHSSFTFSFEDPDGSLTRSLAKSSLFVFGTPVHLKRWTDKPRQQRKMPQVTRPSAA